MANSVNYKTIIKNAIDGFNSIQDKLNSIGAKYGTNLSTSVPAKPSDPSTTAPLSLANLLTSDAFRKGSITLSESVSSTPIATVKSGTNTNISLSSSATSYKLEVVKDSATNGSVSHTVSSFTSGYIGSKPSNTSTAVGANVTTKTFYIPAAEGSIGGSNLSGTNTLSVDDTKSGNSATNVSSLIDSSVSSDSLPTSGYYLKIDGTSSASAQTQTFNISAAGYAPTSFSSTKSVSYSSSKASKYYSLNAASYSLTGNNLSGTNNLALYETDGSNAGVNIKDSIDKTKASTTEPTSGYYVAVTASSSATAQTQSANVTSAGYSPAKTGVATRSVSYSATSKTMYFPINAASHTITGNQTISGTNTLSVNATDGSNAGVNISSTIKKNSSDGYGETSEPTSGYYLSFTAGSSGSSKSVTSTTTAGYTPGDSKSSTVSYSATGKTLYFPITSAGHSITSDQTITGSNTLSLDSDDGSNAGVNIIAAMTKNSDNTYGVSSEPSSGYYLKVSGSSSGSSKSVTSTTTAGYTPGDSKSSTVSYSASKKTTYYPINAASHTITGNQTISGTNSLALYETDGSNAGVNIKNSIDKTKASTTEPTSGYYVAVTGSSSGSSKSVTSTTTAGYTPGDSKSSTVSYSASSKTMYFPINAASYSLTGNNLSGTNTLSLLSDDSSDAAGINIISAVNKNSSDGYGETTEPTSGYYLKVSASSSATAQTQSANVTSAGYSPAKTGVATRSVSYSSNATSLYYPIKAATCTISGGGLTTNMTTSTDKTYYVDRAVIKDAHTEGYIPASEATTAINSTRVYIKPSTTGSATANTTSTAAVTLTPGNEVKIGAGYYGSDRIIRASKATGSTTDPASGFSANITDKTAAVTIGALSDGKYDVNITNAEITVSASTPGWFSSTTVTDAETKVGVIAAGSCTYSRDSAAIATITKDPSASITTDGISTTTTDTGFKITALAASGTVSASVGAIYDTHTAGYIPAKSKTQIYPASSASTTEKTASKTIYITAASITEAASLSGADTNYGYTTTKPSSGTYVTLTPSASYTNTEGYITAHTSTTGTKSGTAYYQPVVTPTFSGGGLSSSIKTVNGVSVTTVNTTNTSGVGFTVTPQASRAAITYSNSKGAIAAHSGASALAAASNTAGTAATYYINNITVPSGKTLTMTSNAGTTNISANTGTVKFINWKLENNSTDECLDLYYAS